MLLVALYAWGTTADEVQCDSMYWLQPVLEAFVGQARISSANCAEVRAYVADMPQDDGKEHASEFGVTCMHERALRDLGDVRRGEFHGECFGGSPFHQSPVWLSDHGERFEVWKAT
jgi:hypothetical protein